MLPAFLENGKIDFNSKIGNFNKNFQTEIDFFTKLILNREESHTD